MRAVSASLQPHLAAGTPVVSCSKGIERGSLASMPEVLEETIPQARVAVLSGPSFAREIARDLPCGVVLACADPALARKLSLEIRNPRFCVHPTSDVAGAAMGGVMKNVIAIASGIAAGRKLGGAVAALARRLEVRMPVTFALDGILSRGSGIDSAIEHLLRSES